jgi:hypothetical protein
VARPLQCTLLFVGHCCCSGNDCACSAASSLLFHVGTQRARSLPLCCLNIAVLAVHSNCSDHSTGTSDPTTYSRLQCAQDMLALACMLCQHSSLLSGSAVASTIAAVAQALLSGHSRVCRLYDFQCSTVAAIVFATQCVNHRNVFFFCV